MRWCLDTLLQDESQLDQAHQRSAADRILHPRTRCPFLFIDRTERDGQCRVELDGHSQMRCESPLDMVQRMVVVQAWRETIDALHQQVRFGRMQPAGGWHALLEHAYASDFHLGARTERAPEHRADLFKAEVTCRVEVATGHAAVEQAVQRGDFRA